MHWWFRSISLWAILFLASCSIQTVPEERLETSALQGMTVAPATLNVPADSRTGVFLDLLGIFGSTDTFTFTLVTPPAGVSLVQPTLVQSISNRFRRFQGVLRVGPATALGSHVITFQVVSATVTRTATLNLTVTAAPANPTFKLTVSPNNLEVARSNSKTTSVFISRIKGFNQAITLSLDTSATTLTGVTATPVNLSSTAFTSNFTIIASATAAPFGLPFVTKVTGTAGSLIKQSNLTITVKTPSGNLDPSFGGDGIVENSGADRFTLLANDKIVTVKHQAPNLLVKRYNLNGSIDTTFDSDGGISHPDQGLSNNFQNLQGIRALSDNKLIILGSKNAASGVGDSIIILKLKANGQLDTTFSGDGVFTTEMPDDSTITAFAIQADGKIVVGGTDKNVGGGVTLIRILSDGTQLDTSFGELGVVAINSEFKMSAIEEITVQPDGKILMAGARESGVIDDDGTLGRLLPSGLEDSSFAGGFQPIPFNHLNEVFFNIAQDLNQNVLAIGLSGNLPVQGMMVRLKPDAKLDDSFSIDGRLTLDTSFLNVSSTPINTGDLVVQRNNKPVFLIGTELTGFKFLLVRLNTNGTRDTTFNGTGKVNVPSSIGITVEMALDSQGRIVILGATGLARIVP